MAAGRDELPDYVAEFSRRAKRRKIKYLCYAGLLTILGFVLGYLLGSAGIPS